MSFIYQRGTFLTEELKSPCHSVSVNLVNSWMQILIATAFHEISIISKFFKAWFVYKGILIETAASRIDYYSKIRLNYIIT